MFLSVSQITSRISGKDRSNPRLCHSNPLFSRSNPHVSWKQINKQQEKTSSVFSRIKRHLVAKWFSLKISQWILWIFIIVPINISRSGEFSHHFQANTHHNILLIITPIYNISYVYIYIHYTVCIYICIIYPMSHVYIYMYIYIYIIYPNCWRLGYPFSDTVLEETMQLIETFLIAQKGLAVDLGAGFQWKRLGQNLFLHWFFGVKHW